jgi:hypothetical protein
MDTWDHEVTLRMETTAEEDRIEIKEAWYSENLPKHHANPGLPNTKLYFT